MKKLKEFYNKYPVLSTLIIITIIICLTALLIALINNIGDNDQKVASKTKSNKENVIEEKDNDDKQTQNEEIYTKPNNSDEISTSQNDNYNNSSNNNKTEVEVTQPESSSNKDEAVLNYFNEQNTLIANSDETNVTTREKIKTGFQTIYNFLFHGGTIKNTTFKELRTETKLKILEKSLEIDYKIDQKFPNYKENIKTKCHDLKSKAVSKYLQITDDICTKNDSFCQSAKENFNTMKNSFSLTVDFIKEATKKGSNKIKEWWTSRN